MQLRKTIAVIRDYCKTHTQTYSAEFPRYGVGMVWLLRQKSQICAAEVAAVAVMYGMVLVWYFFRMVWCVL